MLIGAVGCLALACVGLNAKANEVGYKRLDQNEARNIALVNKFGIVTYIYAEMGEGKTTMLTSLALSCEVQLRNDALGILLECTSLFPAFPWINLEYRLKNAYLEHDVYDKWSCLRFIEKLRNRFYEDPCLENIFGYDFENYPMSFDNKKYVEDVWSVISDYALAFTIYVTQTSLIVSNYAIRLDSLLMDLGKFPLWDQDFFKRDSRLLEFMSHYSHITDYDMVRLGRQMVKDNKNRYAFGWGVWVYTELDKEAKNTLEQQELKAGDDECNQKNDLMHVLFKMSRHACMVRGRNFVRILADMQRVENITANLRQIGNVALIADRDDKAIVLPWYSPWKLFSPFLIALKTRLDNLFLNDRHLRPDVRLISYSLNKLRSAIDVWQLRTEGVFGCRRLHIEMQTGRMDRAVEHDIFAIQDKKDYSNRFGSDCQVGLFEERGLKNTVGLNDIATFASYIATQDELAMMNGYLRRELERYQNGEDEMAKKEPEFDPKASMKMLSSTIEGLQAIQSGVIKVSKETEEAAQLLIENLCVALNNWSKEPKAK